MNRRRMARGFTLVEVLVALVIVAFGMGAVLSALTSAADNTAWLRDKSLAEWIGFNQISTVRLALQQPSTGSTDGDVEFAGENWHWQQQVDDLDIPGVRRITVKVRRARDDDAGGASEDDGDWLATAIGFRGDAVASASGEVPDWNGTAFTPESGAGGGRGRGDGGSGSGNGDGANGGGTDGQPPGEGPRGGGARGDGVPGGRPPTETAEPPTGGT